MSKVLVACEESQVVTNEFRKLGVECYSCDILDTSGSNPLWHIKGDVLEHLSSNTYDLVIAHPPCTYLSKAGARWMFPEKGKLCKDRYQLMVKAKDFFLRLLNLDCKKNLC